MASTLRRIEHADGVHVDELYARRIEFVPVAPDADKPTSAGRVVFYTEWIYYRNNVQFASAPGPRIEHSFDDVMQRVWDVPDGEGGVIQMSTPLIVGGIMAAFDVLANEYLDARATSLVPLPPVVAPVASDDPPPTEVASA